MSVKDSSEFCLGNAPRPTTGFDIADSAGLRVSQRIVDDAIREAIACARESTELPPVEWKIVPDPAARASCRVVGDPNEPCLRLDIGAGLVIRLWASLIGVFAAERAAEHRTYDRQAYGASLEVVGAALEHMDTTGYLDTDAAVALAQFEDLADLVARAEELMDRARPHLLGALSRAADLGLSAGLYWIASHELAHLTRSHFILSPGLTPMQSLSSALRAGFELDADYQAAFALGKRVARNGRKESPDDLRRAAEHSTIALYLLLSLLEVDRLRYTDSTPGVSNTTVHTTDVGLLAVIRQGLAEGLRAAGSSSGLDEPNTGVEDGADRFIHGMYFLTAGVLLGGPLGPEIDNAALMRAGSVVRHFARSRAEFRSTMEAVATDTLRVFTYYRRFIVEGSWDDALPDLAQATISAERLFDGHNRVAPRVGLSSVDAKTEAKALCELWELGLRADFEAPERMGAGLDLPQLVDRTFRPCPSCGRQMRWGERCRYGCEPLVVAEAHPTNAADTFEEKLFPVESAAWEWTSRVLTETLRQLNGGSPTASPWITWSVSDDPNPGETELTRCSPGGIGGGAIVIAGGFVLRLWAGLCAALYCTHHSQLKALFEDDEQSRMLVCDVRPMRVGGQDYDTCARVFLHSYASLDSLREDAALACAQIGIQSEEHYLRSRYTLKRALAYGTLTAALREFAPYARQHQSLDRLVAGAGELGLSAGFLRLGMELDREFQVGRWLGQVAIGARRAEMVSGGELALHLEEAALAAALTLLLSESDGARRQREMGATWDAVGLADGGSELDWVGRWAALSGGLLQGARDLPDAPSQEILDQMIETGHAYATLGILEWVSGLLEPVNTPSHVKLTRVRDALTRLRGWLPFENAARNRYARALEAHLVVYRHLYAKVCFDFGGMERNQDQLQAHLELLCEYEGLDGRRRADVASTTANAIVQHLSEDRHHLRMRYRR